MQVTDASINGRKLSLALVGDAENAGLENVGPNRRVEKTELENTGPKRMGGIHGTGKRRTKFPGWKTHDHRLLNAKWISIKLKYKLNIIRHYSVVQSAEMQYMSNVKC